MYIGCGRLSIIITEGQMRIFLMTPVGVVVTTRGRERVYIYGVYNFLFSSVPRDGYGYFPIQKLRTFSYENFAETIGFPIINR